MSKVMLSVSDVFLRDMDALARAERRSRSELVREAIRAYVATRVNRSAWTPSPEAKKAAQRILRTRLRLPAGETAASVVRKLRDSRYRAAWTP